MYHPDFETFQRKSQEGNLIPVYKEVLADLETPLSAFRKIDSGNYAFLLESVEGGEKWARYSFLGSNPSLVFRSRGQSAEILDQAGVRRMAVEGDPLHLLQSLLKRYQPAPMEGLPRFFGGLVGYVGYDFVRFVEQLPSTAPDDLQLPDCFFLLTDTLLIFDNLTHKIKIVSNVFLDDEHRSSLASAYQQALRKIDALASSLRRPLGAPLPPRLGHQREEMTSNLSRQEFERAVEEAKEYIRAGDCIQVVLSQRFRTPLRADPLDVYRALRAINPSPYMYYLRLGEIKIAGSSPEVMVRLEDGQIDVRPIAGTRPRGRSEGEEQGIAQELLTDPKERAEHIMLVDLARNDVGRVSRIGTVKVNELMAIERYSHVMHIVSNVQGRLQEGKDAFDVVRACFPAGTVSGAPKIRAMEIIEELERLRRGIYAGAIGYFSFSGNMDTCITIRTILILDGSAYIQVGAGIVADSQPEKEYEETLNKAKAMILAVKRAEEGLE
ncbi:MAG: anthranilate synthase component I [candidate division NC10 bacterium]|nr:anthranilate synthase component I [candidate division NC10 bacterium]